MRFVACVCHIFFIHLSVDRHLGCFHTWTVANNTAVLLWIWGFILIYLFSLVFFLLDKHSEVKLLYHMVVQFLIWGELPCCLYSGYASLHSSQQCTRASFSLHPHQHLSLVFFMMSILSDVRWNTVVVVCISLMTKYCVSFQSCGNLFMFFGKNVYSGILPMNVWLHLFSRPFF